MMNFKKLLLTGVLATGLAVSGFMGTASAESISLDLDTQSISLKVPYDVTSSNSTQVSNSAYENGVRVKTNSIVYLVEGENSDPTTFIAGLKVEAGDKDLTSIGLNKLLNDDIFIKGLSEAVQDELKQYNVKMSDMKFHDTAINGIDAKKSTTDITVEGQAAVLTIVLLAKQDTVWMVGVAATDRAAINSVINSIE